jgi:hypothetical protein
MPPIEESHTPAHAHSNFGEIQSHAIGSAQSVVGFECDVAHIHPDGPGMVENDVCQGVVGQLASESGAPPEARCRVGRIVFATADVDF